MKAEMSIIAVIAIGLASTNPSKSDYVDWIHEKAVGQSDSKLDQALATFLVGPIVNITTTRDNYVLFSVYRTELDSQHKIKVVGFATTFFSPSMLRNLLGDRPNVPPQESATIPKLQQPDESNTTSKICFHESRNHAVLSRKGFFLAVKTEEGQTSEVLDAVVSATVSYSAPLKASFVSATEFDLFKSSEGCAPLFSRTLDAFDSGRVETRSIAGMTVIHLVGASSGASGSRYSHIILLPELNGIKTLTSFDLSHSNMGGFFVGDFGAGHGSGIAIWDAVWKSGTHYSPHPYQIKIYRWDGKQFLPPLIETTTHDYEPTPDALPTKANFPFRDQTEPSDFAHATP